MNTRATMTPIARQLLAALPSAALLATFGAACDQPEPKCTAAHGNFAATFKRVSGDSDGPCAELTSGVLNVQSYNDSGSDGRLDPDKPTLAIQMQEATDVVATGRELDPKRKTFAFGAFDDSEPNGAGICTVSELSRAALVAPATEEVPEMMIDECTLQPAQPAQPAIDIGYRWSNVRIVVTPRALGTKLDAELEYTIGDCKAKYEVAAVWPIVECGSPVEGEPEEEEPSGAAEPPPDDEDAGAEPVVDAGCPPVEEESPAPELEADDDLCKTQSAIPDFPVSCDRQLLMCVLDD